MPFQFLNFSVEVFKVDTWVMRSSCGESLLHTHGIDRIPFHSKHHNLLEPSKIQKLPSHQKSSVWGLTPPKVNCSPNINNYCCLGCSRYAQSISGSLLYYYMGVEPWQLFGYPTSPTSRKNQWNCALWTQRLGVFFVFLPRHDQIQHVFLANPSPCSPCFWLNVHNSTPHKDI